MAFLRHCMHPYHSIKKGICEQKEAPNNVLKTVVKHAMEYADYKRINCWIWPPFATSGRCVCNKSTESCPKSMGICQ